MVGKRKRDDALTPTLHSEQDITTNLQPQKKRKNQGASVTDTNYTIAQILAFKDGISKVTDWTSTTIIKKHVQVIYWFDVEGLSKEECAKRYPNKEGQPCSMTNIFKVYNTYAPRFYAEKGLVYVPLGKRGAAKAHAATVVKTKKKGRKEKEVRSNPLDVRLKELFEITSPTPRLDLAHAVPSTCPHRTSLNPADDLLDPKDRLEDDLLSFTCKTSSTTHGPPSGPQIPRTHLLAHCATIRKFVSKLRINNITHGPEISADTISRFSACITPSLQPRLPTHVTTPYGTFEQEWSMAKLEDLYVFAVTLGAAEVCDLVTDRWVEELRRPEPRVVVDEFGEARCFDILNFGPEFLNFLMVNDQKGFQFFINVLISHDLTGFERIEDTHLANWHDSVKKALIKAIEDGSAIDLFSTSPTTICERFHHHGPEDFTSRLPEVPPQPKIKATAAPKTPARPTLNTRPRYEDMDSDTLNTLRLTIPRFPYIHNLQPRISPADLDPIYRLAAHGTDRLREHRNEHLDKRIQYANRKFNAHHDTEDVCREKLRMCQKKVALFEAEGAEVSVVDVEKALGDAEGHDEDEIGNEDKRMEEVGDESEKEEFGDP